MFIRIKKNKSGSTTVLLLTGMRVSGKKHVVSRIIRSFGTSNDKKAIKSLIEKARAYKNKLEISSPKAKILKIVSSEDIKSCRSYNIGFYDIYGNAFDKVFKNFNKRFVNKLKDLVILRIANPASKLRTANFADEYNIGINVDSIYKLMDQLTVPTIKTIKQIICNHTKQVLSKANDKLDVLFYDLTTIYFETDTQDEIRDFGFSKDGKHQHVQIMLAVIVTKDGLVVDYEEFSGNCYEGHTLIPVLNKIKENYSIDKIVLVADAGLMNKINLKELDKRDIKYVIAARVKNTKKEIKEEIVDIKGYIKISEDEEDVIRNKIIDSKDGDLIFAYHSSKRARKDEYDRQKNIEKIKKHVNSSAKSKLTGSLKKPYVLIDKECKIKIDYNKLESEQMFDGFFGLRTNIKDANPKELLLSYRGLWQVEDTFRIAKHNLLIRPVFHFVPRRIKAHFAICYISLALIRYVCFELKNHDNNIPHEQLHLLLERMRKAQIIDYNNDSFELLEDVPKELIQIYKSLKIKWPKKFGHKVIV